jgi:CubicO group peptidase (beta-lactamase class C family)
MNKFSSYMVSTIVLILLFSVSSKVTAQIHPETMAKLRIELIPKIARSEIVGRGDGPITTLPVIEKSKLPAKLKDIVDDADDVFEHEKAVALVLADRNGVIYENYKYKTNRDTLFFSLSMAKSVVSMTVGAALCGGKIKSLDDLASTYVKELSGSSYGKTSIRNLLSMSSGVLESFKQYQASDFRLLLLKSDISDDVKQFNKSYDLKRLRRFLLGSDKRDSIVNYLSKRKSRDVDAGKNYLYNGQDTDTIGLVVARASGTTLAKYTSQEIWQKIGAKSSAKWLVDKDGDAFARLGFYAQSLDWIRLGRFIINTLNGRLSDKCFANYLEKATSGLISKKSRNGEWYGFQFHTNNAHISNAAFEMRGLGGQRLVINPVAETLLYSFAGALNGKWVGESGLYKLFSDFSSASNTRK